MNNKKTLYLKVFVSLVFIILLGTYTAVAEQIAIPRIGLSVEPAQNPADTAASIQILLILTVLTIAPAILIMMTSFTESLLFFHFCEMPLELNKCLQIRF